MNVVSLHGVTRARTDALDRAVAAQRLSDRHRLWGIDCPAVNLDFIAYDLGKPTALIEYKHEYGAPIKTGQALLNPRRPLSVMRELAADRLPFVICRHADDFSWFKARPLNDPARRVLPHQSMFDEVAWVEFLYGLGPRRRRLPRHVQDYLNGQPRLYF